MQILQITDPHLYGGAHAKLRGVETAASLEDVLDDAFARAQNYAAVLVTGDIVQDDPAGYLRFRSMFADLKMPVLCIPGNHDEPDAMRATLNMAPFQIGGSFCAAGWQIIMLDSYDPGHVGGRLTAAELERLDVALSSSNAHAMISLHHHPVDIDSRWLDSIGLANAGEFWRIVDSHAHVRAISWGHVHQEYAGARGSVRLFATPSTGAQFLPHSERYTIDSRPPGYRCFELQPSGRITSEVHWVASRPMCQTAAAG